MPKAKRAEQGAALPTHLEHLRRRDIVKEVVNRKICKEQVTGFLTKDDLIEILRAESNLEAAKQKYEDTQSKLKNAESKQKEFAKKEKA